MIYSEESIKKAFWQVWTNHLGGDEEETIESRWKFFKDRLEPIVIFDSSFYEDNITLSKDDPTRI